MSDSTGVAVDLGRYAAKVIQQRNDASDEVAKLLAAVDQLVEENTALKEENTALKGEAGETTPTGPVLPPPPVMSGILDPQP